ncbi:glycosyltransferase family 39 protein [Rathayibacter soli]|uniref:glycosyltransferase family 39 protein n=1 Tax=Rathayibacter soli TaxID=3144168 RepID=UPI0027E48598|nr:glycosyltransferase family 39 protein [Glaciibacter superstes]
MLSEIVLPRTGAPILDAPTRDAPKQHVPARPARIPTRRFARSGPLALLFGLLGFAVAAAGSWIPSLWGDEAASIMSAERSWPSLFAMLGHIDSVHGAYYVFLHVWIDLFGASAFSVRVPSAIATGLATAGLVILAHRLGGPRVAVVSAIVYMIIPRVTYMGTEAREYAFTATCAVWLTVLLVHLVRTRSRSALAWLGYGVALAASIYVFLYLAMMVLVHAAIVLSVNRERRMMRRWLLATVLAVLCAAPAISLDLSEGGQISFLANRVTVDFTGFFVDQWFWTAQFAIVAWLFILCALGVFATRWVREWRHRSAPGGPQPGSVGSTDLRSPSFAVVATAWLVIPTVLLVSVNLVHAVYAARYLSFVTPAVAMMIAAGICLLTRRWMVVVAVCALVALAAPSYLHQRGPFGMPGGSDWSEVASTISSNAQPGDAIVFTEGGSPSQNPRSAKYLYPQAFQGLDDVTLVTPYEQTTGIWDRTEPVSQAATRLASGNGRVWLVLHRGVGTPAHPAELTQLEALGYAVTSTIPENNDVVYLMQHTP